MSFLKGLFISANVGITLFCIQDQFIGLGNLSFSFLFIFISARVKTDGLQPDLPKGAIVVLQKSFDKFERGDVVFLR